MESEDMHLCSHKKGCHSKRGPSSFWMHDPKLVFKELNLKKGDTFLDLGCGTGDYSLYAAEEVGESGLVFSADVHKELTDALIEKADSAGLKNIKTTTADLYELLPFDDSSIDVCFICTVLHSVDLPKAAETLFTEIQRILKPKGRLSIIECKVGEVRVGPPQNMRIPPGKLEKVLSEYGFEKKSLLDLGYNYMMTFCLAGANV
ncbi:class I SAM-dependent methyltransferase [Methanomicrobium sp. W14]|uniref:class I SAM-dependent methyltransferase n=1 Tax=Methanomicrobium sp. W14 TaxID=2817839 RepID=UPI001AE272CF|nr:methyltransferase domain-containing protein [Methanomicrobium sp. W14]